MSIPSMQTNPFLISLEPNPEILIQSFLSPKDLAVYNTLVCKYIRDSYKEETPWKKRAIFQLGTDVGNQYFEEYKSWKKVCEIVTEIGLKINGVHQQGQFRNGLLQGEGRRKNADGTVEEGYFIDGLLNGQGKKSWFDENEITHIVYKGNFLDGLAEGEGTIFSVHNAESIVSHGLFKNGRLSSGSITSPNGIIDGVIRNNRLEGPGKRILADGTREAGEFHEGYLNGKGKRIYHNGIVEEGQFVEGLLFGQGKRTYPDGREAEEGEFMNGSLITCCGIC